MDRLTNDESTTLGLIGAGVVLTAVTYLMTGCGGVVIAGTPDGIREWGRFQNGTISEARTPEGQKGSFWQNEDLRETEKTRRETADGFWSRLVTGGAK